MEWPSVLGLVGTEQWHINYELRNGVNFTPSFPSNFRQSETFTGCPEFGKKKVDCGKKSFIRSFELNQES